MNSGDRLRVETWHLEDRTSWSSSPWVTCSLVTHLMRLRKLRDKIRNRAQSAAEQPPRLLAEIAVTGTWHHRGWVNCVDLGCRWSASPSPTGTFPFSRRRRALPLAWTKKSRSSLETSSFDIDPKDRRGATKRKSEIRDSETDGKITLRCDCTRGKRERNANDSLKRFNRERYSRVQSPRLSAASDSATLLLDIGTVFYEGSVTPFSRPYHLWRPRYKSPHPTPSSPHFAAFYG